MGHRFWIGAASITAARGIEDYTIRTMGRWKSAAYLLYVSFKRKIISSDAFAELNFNWM